MSVRAVLSFSVVAALLGHAPAADAQPANPAEPLATAQLRVEGSRLTLFADAETDDADQTLNVAEPARVRTCFGGVAIACGAVVAGDPRIAGLEVHGELRGPELPQPVPFVTLPGGSFELPGFQQAGDYRLENIRLVSAASGRVLGYASPPVAQLRVRQILLASARVRQLTLAELEARGVTLSEENFQAFDFAVGFAFDGELVEIELPVLFNGNGSLQPLLPPAARLDELPAQVREMVRRWQPPNVVPFRLDPPEGSLLRLGQEGEPQLELPLFGAIVVPGTVSYLNQFFDAQLVVANGAAHGSDAELANVLGGLRLPSGGGLRLARTDPPVAPGQQVPVVRPDGGRRLGPGEQGTAGWTLEGVLPGTQVVQIDIAADLLRSGREPLPLVSRVQAAVEVVDARFHLTFSHPDVVREGEAYSLFCTVSNQSPATQNLITVALRQQSLTGADREDPTDDLRRTIASLEPGQTETVEFRLVAELDGKVIATTFQSSSAAGLGTIELRAGVGELGIPLSPATLVLPRFSERLARPFVPTDELLRSHVRLLGLAYSLAVAPPGRTPPGLPRVIRSDVERRAIDLAEAGQRTYLQEGLLESLEILALDQLGNRHPLLEYDALRRSTVKGLRAASQLAERLRAEQAARGLSALDLLDHFAETASYADPWLAALLVPAGPEPLPELAILDPDSGARLAHPSDHEALAVRTLEYGEIYALAHNSGGGRSVPLAVVGWLELDRRLEIRLRNPSPTGAAGRLLVVLPDGASGDYRRLDLGIVRLAPLGAAAVEVGAAVPDPAAGGFALFDPETGLGLAGTSAPIESRVRRPPFRLVGAVQDFRLAESGPDALGNMTRPNRYGNAVSYLFNRPPDPASAELAASYRIRSTWSGLDTAGRPACLPACALSNIAAAAFLQPTSERVVHVRYASPLSALVDPSSGDPLVEHRHELDTAALRDRRGEPLDTDVPAPIIEERPLHVGGLVEGRVVRGTGEGAAGATVELIQPRIVLTPTGEKVKLDLAGETVTDGDGRFYFDFVEQPSWDRQVLDPFTLRATVPAGADPELEPETEQEISSVIRQQNRIAQVNIALLGRGTARGHLVYASSGEPVEGGSVDATSTLFGGFSSVRVGDDGSFRLPGLPVGPVTLTGRDREGRRVYASIGIEAPGQVVDVRLELLRTDSPALGTVVARVRRRAVAGPAGGGGELQPVSGAEVAVYSEGRILERRQSDAFGNVVFIQVPAGQVSLQASDFRVSRAVAFVDLVLKSGERRAIDLELTAGATRTVHGRVEFRDPLTGALEPVEGAAVFITGPGVFAHTGGDGAYRIESVPVQAVGESPFDVTAIDFERRLQGQVPLPPILDASPSEIAAQPIVLERMVGGIDGVVLDPLGRPLAGAEVVLRPFAETTTGGDGSFSFDSVPLGTWSLAAHVGDGLEPGRVGYLGESETQIVFGGHRPFVTLRMRGAGVLQVHTRTATSTGVLTPIFYRPTVFSEQSKGVTLEGQFRETSTDPDGRLELVLPVGEFELVAFNPFHGQREVAGRLAFAGQIEPIDILFEDASTVVGRVLDIDGVTPVGGMAVTLHTGALKPQSLISDALGEVRFELVPEGPISLTAEGLVGSVERVGRTDATISEGGQTLELDVELKAQGTVRGRVIENLGTDLVPLAHAQLFVRESSFPFRRLPADGTFFVADADGRFEVSHLYAGRVTVVARDSFQVSRSGSTSGEITADWQMVDLPDVVLTGATGSLEVLVRDPQSGAPVADAVVRLSNGEATVSNRDGIALFDALPLARYSVYAFYAPTGRGGRLSDLDLAHPGQRLAVTLFLDRRGEVRGTLYADPGLGLPVDGGTVELNGRTASGRLRALATTGGVGSAGGIGRFAFRGIPEGEFDLVAVEPTSPRQARTMVELTATAPFADVNLVLEPAQELWVRLFESLTSGLEPIDPVGRVLSVRLRQSTGGSTRLVDFTRIAPEPGTDLFFYPGVLSRRRTELSAAELGGEQRRANLALPDLLTPAPSGGSGSFADPVRLVLAPKGVVEVRVRGGGGAPVAGASVTLHATRALFPSITGGDGAVTFTAVPAGSLTATATSPGNGLGGTARGELRFDDEIVTLEVELAPAVSASGIVYAPVAGDRFDPLVTTDPGGLVPAAGTVVTLTDRTGSTHRVFAAADGGYRFDGLPVGSFALVAQSLNGEERAVLNGALLGPDGNDNRLPSLVLDASPPRILSIVPPPGLEGVSRTAAVEIRFSEPLAAAVLPSGSTSPFFALRSADGALAAGSWSAVVDAEGAQLVRFEPSTPYDNLTTYSLLIAGGPAGVSDRVGRPLTDAGDVGSNFTTSDSIGPAVVAVVPDLAQPVAPGIAIRVDFNEALVASAEQLDGDGIGDAAQILASRDDGSEVALPVTLILTRANFSLQVLPVGGVVVAGDTLRRRLLVSGLEDRAGNRMPDFERAFRIFDGNPPVIVDVPLPAGAEDGSLRQGVSYALEPILAGVDDATPERPGGDIERVEYFFTDPAEPGSQPGRVAPLFPFRFDFVAAYSGNGVDPRPFPVWVRAIDSSDNRSNIVLVDLEVLPNATPELGDVTVTAVAPVAGTFYAGSTIEAAVSGIDDADGNRLTLAAELWRDGDSEPLSVATGRTVDRPAGGWSAAPAELFRFALDLELAEGASLFVVAEARDSQGAVARRESDRFEIADDATPPVIDSLVARRGDDGEAALTFFIGEQLSVEVRGRDRETSIDRVDVRFDRDDLFPGPVAADPVSGSPGLYRTATLSVPADAFAVATPVSIIATVRDVGGNQEERSLTVEVAPDPDPTAPEAVWLTPWSQTPWPADYGSQSDPRGVPLLLRAEVIDTSLDADGAVIPGEIVRVSFRGPVAGAGGVELAANWTDGELVPGSDGPGRGVYQLLWHLPDRLAAGSEPLFAVRAVDSGGLSVVSTVTMTVAPARRVYEQVATAILPEDPMLSDPPGDPDGDPDGLVFLLASRLSLVPDPLGSIRELPGLVLLSGGESGAGGLVVQPSVLTAPEITSYASADLFHPLEFRIGELLAVGAASRIDMGGRGLLGSRPPDDRVALAGETAAEPRAGGSHGGSGWFGSPGGWDRGDLAQPGSVFDDLRDPALPGGGGGGTSASRAGGSGGGVVRLLAVGATVRLVGDLLVGGEDGELGAGGGAGGAVRIDVARLEGRGRIDAGGGHANDRRRSGGGGGGRVAITYGELGPDVDLEAQVDVTGGHNRLTQPASAERLAGAGTLYLEQIDGRSRSAGGVGRLRVANPSGLPAAITPIEGDQRFNAVAASGSTRLVFDGDLLVGDPADPAPALNDRASVELGPEARLLLRGGRPALTLATDPAPSSELLLGSTIDLRWSASDALGLRSSDERSAALAGVAGERFYDGQPLEITASGDPVVLQVPVTTLPGPVELSVEVADVAGRRERRELTFTVLANAPPLASVAIAGGGAASVKAGFAIDLIVHAEDREGLSQVTLNARGPAGEPQQTRSVAGTAIDLPFTVQVPVSADGSQPLSVEAAVTDIVGSTTTSAPLAIAIVPNELPSGRIELAPGSPAEIKPGTSTRVRVLGEDPDGIESVEFLVSGPATEPSQTAAVDGTAVDVPFTVTARADATPSPLTLSARLTDVAGASFSTPPLVLEVVEDLPPTLSLAVLSETELLPGAILEVAATVEDDLAVATVTFTASGAISAESVRQPGTMRAVEVFRDQLPTSLLPGDLVAVTVEVADSFGHLVQDAVVFTVLPDLEAPAVSIELEPAVDNDSYLTGDAIVITANASDEVAVANVGLTVDGTSVTGPSPLVHVFTGPVVGSPTPFEVVATASDLAGNLGEARRSLIVAPFANAVAPTLELDCPSDGAALPSGYDLPLALTARDDLGVARIELFRDDEADPLATFAPAAGPETPFAPDVVVSLPVVAAAERVRLRAVAFDAWGNRGELEIGIDVVPTVDLDPAGLNDWAALESEIAVLRVGALVLTEARRLAGLILLDGATMSHPPSAPGAETQLELTIDGPLYVGCAAAIDTSGAGYGGGRTLPGETLPGRDSGGSHLGSGGLWAQPLASTFGSPYRPQESGGGGQGSSGGPGGGVVVLRATTAVIDGAVRSNGVGEREGGAGGSISIAATTLSGTGSIEAIGGVGGAGGFGAGGGGAIALEYGSISGPLLENLSAHGGSGDADIRSGGAGTIYRFGPDSTYGNLTIANPHPSQPTVLPALGSGIAQAASGGTQLVTDLVDEPPSFFIGHWVEILDPASDEVTGAGRIAAINGPVLSLVPESGAALEIAPGDRWRGVYRFDAATLRGRVALRSADPIQVVGRLEIDGEVELRRIEAGSLVVGPGSVLTHPQPAVGEAEALAIELSGSLVIEPGGAIDVSGRGFAGGQSYPGATRPGRDSGGSHLGIGGLWVQPLGTSFGSLYRPQEAGGGGQGSTGGDGGGVVRIVAEEVVLEGSTSAIRANGVETREGGAGGSVWITAGTVSGEGRIEARGGGGSAGGFGGGGGGTIAVEYGSSSGSLLENPSAIGGAGDAPIRSGGAGTVYLNGPTSVYGDLLVDAGSVAGQRTVLPALGGGVAQPGSSGSLLVSDRVEEIPAYFVGHWVEIRDGASGALEGSFRIASVSGRQAVLVSSIGSIAVDPGDRWQGVYRFDNFTAAGTTAVDSADPIRVEAAQQIRGTVELRRVEAGSLVIAPGAVLTHPQPAVGEAEALAIELSGSLVIEPGGAIDVSGRGFAGGQSYPGATRPGRDSGGSHLGIGGLWVQPLGSSFGSLYRPQEAGGGGQGSTGGSGGGVVRITADQVMLEGSTSAIRANGLETREGGAGGSIWITAGGVAGDGQIEVRGGGGAAGGFGGGGAIAVEYESSSGSLLANLIASGGPGDAPIRSGGAGTVYLFGPASTYGDLRVDNGGLAGQATELPALGSGNAQPGSAGGLLVTDRVADIPAYFVGHWVELRAADTTLKGYLRIAAVAGASAELEAEPGESVIVEDGDLWQGVYRFDQLTVGGEGVLDSVDPIEAAVQNSVAGSSRSRVENRSAPSIDERGIEIAVGEVPGSYRIRIAPSSMADADGVGSLRLTDGKSWLDAELTPGTGATLYWPGRAGDRLTLIARDAHRWHRRSSRIRLAPLPSGPRSESPFASFRLPPGERPRAVLAGEDWIALADRTLRLFALPAGSASGSDLTGVGETTAVESLLAEVTPVDEDDRVVGLAAAGGTLVVGRRDRLELLALVDREGQLDDLPLATGESLVDLAIFGEAEAVLLLERHQAAADRPGDLVYSLRTVELGGDRAELELSPSSNFRVERSAAARLSLLPLPGSLHLVIEGRETRIASFPLSGAGEIAAAEPEHWQLDRDWRPVGSWSAGLVMARNGELRLLAYSSATGWSETGRFNVAAGEVLAAFGRRNRLVVVEPGAVSLVDLSAPERARTTGRFVGSSHRELTEAGRLLLWSSGFNAPPVPIDLDAWPPLFVSGSGFVPVLTGERAVAVGERQ